MTWTFDPIWWITAVELPALAGLFVLIWRARRESQDALDRVASRLDVTDSGTRDQLAAFKVDVATSYASIPALRESEGRLTAHLVRIEKKLDCLGFGRPAIGDRP
ncbi:hypothetical protein CKO28_11530 [Rhodovibrio sodomensis]|uniref:Envelope stress response membrane protein PspB n=1 Tax=Rhodovibrio sodomensis TaxID=1088 RepID=A0ABS1DH01_9PROT|nr:hypothetical protein [Rhodovibrio sodomensis]MBK1668660.1 hypothetical protein [Rhodovibrio sodomensis]